PIPVAPSLERALLAALPFSFDVGRRGISSGFTASARLGKTRRGDPWRGRAVEPVLLLADPRCVSFLQVLPGDAGARPTRGATGKPAQRGASELIARATQPALSVQRAEHRIGVRGERSRARPRHVGTPGRFAALLARFGGPA